MIQLKDLAIKRREASVEFVVGANDEVQNITIEYDTVTMERSEAMGALFRDNGDKSTIVDQLVLLNVSSRDIQDEANNQATLTKDVLMQFDSRNVRAMMDAIVARYEKKETTTSSTTVASS